MSLALDLPEEIQRLLEDLLGGVQHILGEQLVGMYLYGSLASGDFSPATSDIDFLVVTRAVDQTVAAFEALGELHARLMATGNPWASRVEGAYVPVTALRRDAPEFPALPCTNEGQFYLARLEDDWVIRRHLLRQASIVLTGPPVQDLIDPIAPEALRRSLVGFLQNWWQPMIERSPAVPFRLDDDEYQRYAVLTMCRILNTFETGDFVSKRAAAAWALRALEPGWHALIQRALDWQPGGAMAALAESVEFIRYTVKRGL